MSRTTGRRRRAAYAIGALVALATTACTAEPPPPPTLRVDRGTVATTVSASGTLVGISEQNLGFAEGGKLVEVLVGVGARVEPGQVLARVDDFELRQTLEQEQARLAQQQAELDRARGGNSVNATGRTLEQAKEILEATEKQASETNEANRSATDRARKQLDFDREVLDRAEDTLRRTKSECRSGDDEESQSAAESEPPATKESTPTEEPDRDSDNDSDNESDDEDGDRVRGASYIAQTTPACDRIATEETAVENAKRTVLASETELDAAKHREDVDAASGRVSVENAKQSVVTAENDRGSARNEQPSDINGAEALVREAQAAVAIAQRNVDNTVLTAPVAGVVSAINGRVGEYLGGASGTTPLAPGSTAALPGATSLASGGDSGGGGGTAAPGGGAFMVLNNVDSFQLVVPFEESDASRVAVNQPVEVTVDAIPDLRAPATVLAIAPSGDPSSGIVEYYATIVLREGSDPRLRDGQTALADVAVESVENTLRVPSAAVRRDGGGTVVDVRDSEGQPVPTPFQAGTAGDEYTQVISGLREGQELLLPQPAAG
ncbi:biotin/lipoyl-binding protein [Pseudonocardia kunmingensis]|uniref:HlyD family secretion protein n=1 Tax=Pseudonocardia kunmingensis TaxID=630975 RepID=A0A543DI87_9PSEU|nr:biotin/lipoyl-binding protein [Pseudonocardia kunmingensis]TQM09031.1 HlyD family secretion protein [Pseudonocardia kunmingensis]